MGNGEECYRRYLDGDSAAFGDILCIYRDGLTFFIDGYVHDIYEAEDIAMDTFLYLLTHPGRYDFRVSLKTYLYMLARSRAIDRLRRRARMSVMSINELPDAADRCSLEEEFIAGEKKRALYAALGRLPDSQREAVRLVYLEDMSYTDAARVMKKAESRSTIWSRGQKERCAVCFRRREVCFYEKKQRRIRGGDIQALR